MSRTVPKRDEVMFKEWTSDWCKQRTQPLEVMCLGLCRTGTTSMLEALSILGYGTSYNSREMLRRGHASFCAEGFRAKHEGGQPFGLEQFESMFGEYRTISGEPAYVFAAEFIELYPDAKVVLTVRDNEEKWLKSLMSTMWYGNQLLVSRFLPYVSKAHSIMHVFTKVYWKYMFWDDVPNHGVRVYREHNAMVQRLAAERVLVFNTKDGWKPLCEFLGKEVPDVDFPHVNQTDYHRSLFASARQQALRSFVKRLLIRGILPVIISLLLLWKKEWTKNFLRRLRR